MDFLGQRDFEQTPMLTQIAYSRIREPQEVLAFATEIRRLALSMIYHAGSGHPGGCLSSAELMAYLWGIELQEGNWKIDDPYDEDRHRFILSKGHSCPALYAAAAIVGLLPHSALPGFRKMGSVLQGHPDVLSTPWVHTSTGSLGQGFSAAIGMALGLKYKKGSARIYVMLGDGELQEGMVWEGVMSAGHYHLDNLCAIVDYNKMQSDDLNRHIMGLEPLRDKWSAFHWHVKEIDGHDPVAIGEAFQWAKHLHGKPSVIIAHTIKGKGVSFMEGIPAWHGSVKIQEEEMMQALGDLETPVEDISRYIEGQVHG